jgi:hypothetical protein
VAINSYHEAFTVSSHCDRVPVNGEIPAPTGFELKTDLHGRFALKSHADNPIVGCHRPHMKRSANSTIAGPCVKIKANSFLGYLMSLKDKCLLAIITIITPALFRSFMHRRKAVSFCMKPRAKRTPYSTPGFLHLYLLWQVITAYFYPYTTEGIDLDKVSDVKEH